MRCDVRELALTTGTGAGLEFAGADPFTFAARRLAVEDLAQGRHIEDLLPRPFVELCLDHGFAGTGNTSLRAERLSCYKVPAVETRWQMWLKVGCTL